MSNYITAVTLASPTPVASPGPTPPTAKAVQNSVPEAQATQVTLSTAALALSQSGPRGTSNVLDTQPDFSTSSSNQATPSGQSAVNSPNRASSVQVAKYVDPHSKYVDPQLEHNGTDSSAKVELSTAAQVMSMSQTGSSVDEIAAVLGMSVSDVSSELGVSSPASLVAAAAQNSVSAALHA